MAKFRFRGISLGITFVFFAGILAGALGLKLDPQMVSYAESFGLILFVYTLGLQVGPGFVTTFKHGGTWLNILSLAVVIIGTIMAVVIAMTGWLPFCRSHGSALWCHHQHSCPRCCTANTQTVGTTLGSSRLELCRHLPHRHGGRHHCLGDHARMVATPRQRRRHRPRRRGVHHCLLCEKSCTLWQRHLLCGASFGARQICGIAHLERR